MKYGNLRYAVLGLVRTRPEGVHGYQLKTELEPLCGEFWRINFGSLYRVLDNLDSCGDLESTLVTQGSKPNRRVYRITESGRRTLDDWLLQPVTNEPRPLRDELALKLLFLDESNLDALHDQMKKQRTIYVGKLAQIARWRQKLRKTEIDASVTNLVMDGAELRVRADLAWLDLISRKLLLQLATPGPRETA